MASIAPSAAPAETPSVNGVASGLRSSACRTTPDAASAAPTSAAARTRGRRATKKICASTFSVHGTDGSKARPRSMAVLPSVGARMMATAAVAAKSGSVVQSRRVSETVMTSAAPARRRAGRWPDGRARRRPRRRARAGARGVSTSAVGPAATIRPGAAAPARRQVLAAKRQVVRRDDEGHAAPLVQVGEEMGDLELRAEIERRGRLVEQQHLGGLGQGRGDHDPLLLAAAEGGEVAVFEPGRADRASASRATTRSAGPSTSNTPRCG